MRRRRLKRRRTTYLAKRIRKARLQMTSLDDMDFNPKESKVTALRDCPVPESMLICETPLPVRKLKIEADGDFWKGLMKPKIRLMGRWLARAGFQPGNCVHVTCVA